MGVISGCYIIESLSITFAVVSTLAAAMFEIVESCTKRTGPKLWVLGLLSGELII